MFAIREYYSTFIIKGSSGKMRVTKKDKVQTKAVRAYIGEGLQTPSDHCGRHDCRLRTKAQPGPAVKHVGICMQVKSALSD